MMGGTKRMKSKNKIILISIILLVVLLGGCTNVENNGTNSNDEIKNTEENNNEAINLDPEYGGEINVSIRLPETLNPILNEDRTVDQVLKMVFEPLFILDESQQPIPNIADSYKISEDGKLIEIYLNEDVKWQDGTDLTAKDVVFTINQIKDNPTSIYSYLVQNISNASVADDKKVDIYFNQASSTNLYALTFPVIPEHYYNGEMTTDSNTSMNPLGNGMYKFDSYDPNKSVKLIVNESWHNGRPYVEVVNCIIIVDDETDSYSFNQGIIDVFNPNVYNWQEFAQTESLSIFDYTSYYYDFLGFNFNNELLNDANVRKAIAYGVNRDEINKNIYVNQAEKVDYPIHPDSYLVEDIEITYDYNAETALNLLGMSGYENRNDEGIFVNNGKSLSFKLLVNKDDEVKVQVANSIKNDLKKIGIGIEINSLNDEDYRLALEDGNYDIVLGSWKLSTIPDLSFAFHSANIANNSNFINYSSDKMDELLVNAYNAYTNDSIKTAYNHLVNHIIDDVPYYSLFFRKSAVILDRNVYGEMNPSTYYNFRGFENIYVETK